jgi:hypothetical protein
MVSVLLDLNFYCTRFAPNPPRPPPRRGPSPVAWSHFDPLQVKARGAPDRLLNPCTASFAQASSDPRRGRIKERAIYPGPRIFPLMVVSVSEGLL